MSFILTLALIFGLGSAAPLAAPQDQKKARKQQEKSRQEEKEDYYAKWLNEDVKYIIADEEKEIFEKLSTPEEKENFIEQFWFRRDPNPDTAANEFKAEHYRRIAYVNENFQSGKPGWMTDRGRVYIIHGEPAYIERHPSGGSYTRQSYEGGGQSFAYPYEIWNYRYIESMGDTMELEFVDPSFSGEYRLALRPEEKDMLLYVPGTAPTIRELTGRDSGRKDRPFFNPRVEGNPLERSLHGYRSKDAPFARYARYAFAQTAPEIKFADLKEVVTTNITYHDLAANFRSDLIRLNEDQVLAPITLEVDNRELNFELKDGVYRADVNVYGVVRSLIGKVVSEFEDTVIAEYKPEQIERGRLIKSVYQKLVVLEAGHRYRVDLVVRDRNSNRTVLMQSGLTVPGFKDQDKLASSSMILSRFVQTAPENQQTDRFVLGDLKIVPNVTNVFHTDEKMSAYLQLYNAQLDQTSLSPQLEVRYRVRRGDAVVSEFQDNSGESIQYFSPQRIVLLNEIDLTVLEPGDYQFEIEVKDALSGNTTSSRQKFKVEEPVSFETSASSG